MIRMTKVPTTQTPSTTKPFLSHTSRDKTRSVFLSQPVDIFDEPISDSTEAILLEKDKPDPFSPSPTVKSAPNLFGTKRIFTRVHSTFPENSKKLIIEQCKDVKVIHSTQHSTNGNHQPIPQPKPAHSPEICPLPDDPPQDVDKSHLSESTSTTTNLNETCSLDTSCDHLLQLDSPSLSSELQDTSSVESVETEFVPDFEEPLESNNFSPTDVFSVQHDYDLFLLNQEIDTPSDNLDYQDTHVCEKQGQDDFLIHATNLSHNFALPQFMAEHNCENLKPTDTPSTFSTFN